MRRREVEGAEEEDTGGVDRETPCTLLNTRLHQQGAPRCSRAAPGRPVARPEVCPQKSCAPQENNACDFFGSSASISSASSKTKWAQIYKERLPAS